MSASGSDRGGARPEPAPGEDELVAFFLALSPEARAEYAALAERDRRFGEDVDAELRATAGGGT